MVTHTSTFRLAQCPLSTTTGVLLANVLRSVARACVLLAFCSTLSWTECELQAQTTDRAANTDRLGNGEIVSNDPLGRAHAVSSRFHILESLGDKVDLIAPKQTQE